MIGAAPITLLTATINSAPNMTSIGWLFVFLATTLVLTILFGISGWAYQKWNVKEDVFSNDGSDRNSSPSVWANSVNITIGNLNVNEVPDSGQAVSAKSTINKITAYIHFNPQSNEITGSFNISSYIDNGLGDFTFCFIDQLDKNTIVVFPIGETPIPVILEATHKHVRVKFEKEPSFVKLRFDSMLHSLS